MTNMTWITSCFEHSTRTQVSQIHSQVPSQIPCSLFAAHVCLFYTSLPRQLSTKSSLFSLTLAELVTGWLCEAAQLMSRRLQKKSSFLLWKVATFMVKESTATIGHSSQIASKFQAIAYQENVAHLQEAPKNTLQTPMYPRMRRY